MKYIILMNIVVAFAYNVYSAKILFLAPVPAISHQKVYQKVWKELSYRGHDIHVITPNPLKNRSLLNVVEYDVSDMYNPCPNLVTCEDLQKFLEKPTFISMFQRETIFQNMWSAIAKHIFSHKEFERMLANNKEFDLCIIEWFVLTNSVMAHLFKCPLVGISSDGVRLPGFDAVGNPSHPVLAPDQDLPLPRSMSFFERLYSGLWTIYVRFYHAFVTLPAQDKIMRKYLGQDLPYLGDLEKNISLLLVNRNPILHRLSSNLPAVVEYGFIKPEKGAAIVDPKLQNFLNNSMSGVVYFSLGSSVQGTMLHHETVKVIQKAFADLPYHFLWKWETPVMDNKPDNVFISPWLPQEAVLGRLYNIKSVCSVVTKMRLSTVVVLFGMLLSDVRCARILFVANAPVQSHQKVYQQVWKELARRGHDTHVLSPNPLKENPFGTLTQYDLSDIYPACPTITSCDKFQKFLEKPTFISMFRRERIFDEICTFLSRHVFTHKEFKRLTPDTKFDVCIIEWFCPTLSFIGHHLNCTVIGISSDGVRVPGFDTVGNPSHPLLAPDQDLPLQTDLTFFDRLWSGIWAIYGRLYHHFVVLPREDSYLKDHFGDQVPYLGELEKNIAVLLVNRNNIFHRLTPNVPAVINYGVLRPEKVHLDLEPSLKHYLDESKNGVIYFSLGSAMKGIMLDPKIIRIIQNALVSLPYDFLWKWEAESMENKPTNVAIRQWFPQESILEHPNVKLFITQGGLQSTEETIAAHKPIIGIPFHSDQTSNVDTCVRYGMGKMLDLKDLTTERLKEFIVEVINDPSYTENVKKMDLLINDQPMEGLQKAIWWIEYVIRHKGAKHLRSPAVDMPWWEYLMLDVIAFVFAIVYFITYIIYKSFVVIFRRRRCRNAKKKNQSHKSMIMKLSAVSLIGFCCCFGYGQTARILFATGMAAPSHQKPFQQVWRALSLKGHEVHVITPNPLKDKSLVNLSEYDLSSLYELKKTVSSNDMAYMTKKPSFFQAFSKDLVMIQIWTKLFDIVLSHNETQRLLQQNLKFDVVIVEWLFPTLAGLGAHYTCPLIGISSLGAPVVALDALGNPSHPIIAPDMNLPLTRDMTLRERLMSSLYSLYVRLYYHLWILPTNDKIVKKYLGQDLPYLGDIEKNVSLLLLNRNSVFHRPMPLYPNIVEMGGIKYPKQNQTLDKELQSFLDSSKNGVIYFSLGTSRKSNLLPAEILQEIKDAFKNLPYKIVWKWEDDVMHDKPSNVYIRKWLPQTAILAHPNVKLFIYQGGLQSTEEVIAAHKAIIGIPSHSDQTTNVDTCVKYGMGKMLDLEELTAAKLIYTIEKIMGDPSYAENAKKLDVLMNDQHSDGISKAVWWIEYVIRHKGAKHLRNYAVDIPVWKYLMLDIIGYIIAVVVLAVGIVYHSIRFIIKFIRRICKLSSKNTEKNIKNE
ncbi:uncharacterized protein LOC132705109 [Cylas formicarius]|uniref:uncharacterized protein LOC132705109 n=1 Tax=Cylas formicarius TaxID=197179 RepID=UPI0029588727|nr:uncharacterized protein LOC132705109 [Cylas formicarius]